MNKKIIITTTINKPTKATLAFCKKKDFDFMIIGDLKTPHEFYYDLEKEFNNVKYLSPQNQSKLFPDLSDSIGWNCIQRRSIGFVYAYINNYNIIASVDDDNIPYDHWGENVFVGREAEIDLYDTENLVFDPLSVTNTPHLWHRGYPIELLSTRHKINYLGKFKRKILVQADLWDGDPDIDALARIAFKPEVKYDVKNLYGSTKMSPFNSQNTFLHRDVLKFYMMFPFVGRMDDIWPSYLVQHNFPECITYAPASVYQERNPQNVITNLENEIYGYKNTLNFIKNITSIEFLIPKNTYKAFLIYQKYFF
jgi:hypothetical protein